MRKRIRLDLLLFVFIVSIFSMGCQKQDSDWKGTISEENGVTIVKNPKEPMYSSVVFSLEEELAITEADGGNECIFSRVRMIDVDDAGRIYVLESDEAHVYIFGSDGTFIKTFGREGQGPGEFHSPLTMKIINGKELAVENFSRGINFYTLEGEFIRELLTAKAGALRIYIDSHGNVLGMVIVPDEDNPRYELVKFDPEMNKIFTLGTSPLPNTRNEGFNPFSGALIYAIRYDDHILVGNPENYEIGVYTPSGDLITKILKDFDPVEITKEEIEEVTEGIPSEIKVSITKYHNPYRWFTIDDEGRIFVQTYEKINEGEGNYYDIFDPEGKCLVKIPIKGTPRVIKKNKLYTVESDEEGYLTVKRYRIDWNI